jgi:hypothetical protein
MIPHDTNNSPSDSRLSVRRNTDRETDYEAIGLPTHNPFHWQQFKPVPVLTQKEQRAFDTEERNRASARKRSAEVRAAKKLALRVNPESSLCKPHTPNSTIARR